MPYNRTISSRFRAVTADGTPYEIVARQTVFSEINQTKDELPVGDRRLQTPDGRRVLEIAAGEFEIGGSNTPIRVKAVETIGL